MFKYVVTFWDETENKQMTETGLTCGDSWGAAFDRVRDYYGEGNIVGVYLEEWESVLTSEEVLEGLTK